MKHIQQIEAIWSAGNIATIKHDTTHCFRHLMKRDAIEIVRARVNPFSLIVSGLCELENPMKASVLVSALDARPNAFAWAVVVQ